jgi:Ca2+-transporting ATPase
VAALPVPFAPVHLLFINLLTDSLPAIAIGLETHHERIMDEKPRQARESMINKAFAVHIFGEGLLIAICTMAAFYIGLTTGNTMAASTMAFATLCLARLFHGFNCRGKESLWALGIFRNPYVWMAAVCGCLLLEIVLNYAPLARAFEIAALTSPQHVAIYVLALAPFVIIQSYRVVFQK